MPCLSAFLGRLGHLEKSNYLSFNISRYKLTDALRVFVCSSHSLPLCDYASRLSPLASRLLLLLLSTTLTIYFNLIFLQPFLHLLHLLCKCRQAAQDEAECRLARARRRGRYEVCRN